MEPEVNPSLREEWAIAGVLSHLQRALSHHHSKESLNILQHDSASLEQMTPENAAKRVQFLAVCEALMRAERDKEMKKAYDELKAFYENEQPSS